MYNRVKFMLRLSLLQKFSFKNKNKEVFVINKKHNNLNKNKVNNIIIRKIHSSKNEEPRNPFNIKIIIASIVCGTLFILKKNK